MKRIAKKLTLAAFAVVSALGLASCNIEDFNNLSDDEVYLDVDMENKIDLKVLYPNSGMADSEFANSRTTKYFEDLTGYKVKYEQVIGDQGPVLTNILTTQQEYNMVKLESGTFLAEVGNESFVDLKPYLEKYGQDLLNTIPQEAWDAVTLDGKIYAVPEIGFGQMISNALVWNTRQLKEVGITKIPETIGEVDEAFHKLQEHFGANNSSYRAFAMGGAQAYIETLAAAFDFNKDFYVNENNEVAHVMYHPQYQKYMAWLNSLVRDNIISREWQGYTGSDIVSNFSKGNLGCGFMPYWNINTLVESLAARTDYASKEEARESLAWSLYIRGDGTHGSVVQEKPKSLHYYSIGYYCAVPVHMKQYTAYAVDWMNKRITEDGFLGYRLGDEGVHFNYVDSTVENAIKVTIKGEEKYIQLTDKYDQDILPTSMYQTGVNPEVASELWILSEQSYNCWEILIETDEDNILGNAIALAPYIKGWSEIDIASRSWVITLEQQMINASSELVFTKTFDGLLKAWPVKYWTEEVNANVQAWHKSKSN